MFYYANVKLGVVNVFLEVLPLHCTGSPLQHKVQFVWINQEDEAEVRFRSRLLHTILLFVFSSIQLIKHTYISRKQQCIVLGMKYYRFCT